MRLHILITIITSLAYSNIALASSSLKKCFEEDKTHGAISFCIAMANKDLERVRQIIEGDMYDMINDDLYITPPQFYETPSFSSAQISHGKKTFSKADIAVATAKRKQGQIEATNFMLKKQRALEQLRKSEELFVQYREVECKRRQAKTLNDKDSAFLSTLKYSTCIHEMTKQRINSLQKSIE